MWWEGSGGVRNTKVDSGWKGGDAGRGHGIHGIHGIGGIGWLH